MILALALAGMTRAVGESLLERVQEMLS